MFKVLSFARERIPTSPIIRVAIIASSRCRGIREARIRPRRTSSLYFTSTQFTKRSVQNLEQPRKRKRNEKNDKRKNKGRWCGRTEERRRDKKKEDSYSVKTLWATIYAKYKQKDRQRRIYSKDYSKENRSKTRKDRGEGRYIYVLKYRYVCCKLCMYLIMYRDSSVFIYR